MSSRILREGLLTSKRVAQLDYFSRWLYIGLILSVDDEGRMEVASPKQLNAKIFPLDEIDNKKIYDSLKSCIKANLITQYTVNNKDYLQLIDFRQHIRTASKHPPPPTETAQIIEQPPQSTETAPAAGLVLIDTQEQQPEQKNPAPKHTAREIIKKTLQIIYNRRESTQWSEKESKKLAEIARRPDALEEMAAIESLYESGEYQYARRDIITLLNNWPGEVDRAKGLGHGLKNDCIANAQQL